MKELLKNYETMLEEENLRLKNVKNSLSEEEIMQLKSNTKLKDYLDNHDIVTLLLQDNSIFKKLNISESISQKIKFQDLVNLEILSI